MLKTESKDATVINRVASTMCLPGQMRLPYPNAEVNSGSSRNVPSGLRKRSGLKISGSGYMAGSRKIALGKLELRASTTGSETAYHVFPITIAPAYISA